jgi:hypothetical protein
MLARHPAPRAATDLADASPTQEFLDGFDGALCVPKVPPRAFHIATLEGRHRLLQLVIQPDLCLADVGPKAEALAGLLLLEGPQSRARGVGANYQLVVVIA